MVKIHAKCRWHYLSGWGRGSWLHKEKKQSEQHSSLCILLFLQYACRSHPCHRAFHRHTLQPLTSTPPCFSPAHPPVAHTQHQAFHQHTLQPFTSLLLWLLHPPAVGPDKPFLPSAACVRHSITAPESNRHRLSLVVEDQRNGEI